MSSDHRYITHHVEMFLWSEVENHRSAVRNGDLDPAEWDAPTLSSALGSLEQMPEDVALTVFDIERGEDHSDTWGTLADQYLNLALLLLAEGPDRKIMELIY